MADTRDETLSARLAVRVTRSQRAAWERAASQDRRSLADWLRKVADDAAREEVESG